MPAPFGPTMPTRSPRSTRVESRRTTVRSPYAFDTSSATATSRPDKSAWRCRHAHRARRRRAAPAACLRSAMQVAEPLLVALAPRGDAVAQPVLLHRDLAAQLVALASPPAPAPSSRQASNAGEALVERARDAAIEPDGGARDPFQQPPVVADQHDARTACAASSRSSHSMPGRSRWLVGSSSSRMSGDGARTRASAARRASPPDRVAGILGAGQAELFQQVAGAVAIGVGRRTQPGLDIGERGGDSRTGRAPAAGSGWWRRAARSGVPASGCNQAGGDAQQRGLAGAVAPDQAHPVAGARPPGPRRPAAARCRRSG